jgi:hypothetical protein
MNGNANNGPAAAPDDETSTAPRGPALVALSLENVSYHPVSANIAAADDNKEEGRSGRRQRRVVVLNRVSTTIQPHRLTAWMGPSGSTFLFFFLHLLIGCDLPSIMCFILAASNRCR